MQNTRLVSSLMVSLIITSFVSIQNANGYFDASCYVTVQVIPHPSTIRINGESLPRQNSDGTYYPGDAFDFAIMIYPGRITAGTSTRSRSSQADWLQATSSRALQPVMSIVAGITSMTTQRSQLLQKAHNHHYSRPDICTSGTRIWIDKKVLEEFCSGAGF